MPTHLINMSKQDYPFGQSDEYNTSNRTLIRQVLSKKQNNVGQILRLAKIAKKISENKIFIKLETILEEQQSIILLYEYVPIKIEKYIKTMDEKFLKQYRNQILDIADFLAQNGIITTISMGNMGLNEKYEAKYFLGLNFVQKKQVNMYEVKNDYVQEIKHIFRKYMNSENSIIPKKQPRKYTKNLVKMDNRMSDVQEIENVSTYIDPQKGMVKTRKTQSIYYERSKDHQIKKRKQSYMSSVSNLRLNNLYRRINQIELQVCKTSNKNVKLSIEGRQFTSRSKYENAKQAIQVHNRLNNNPNSYYNPINKSISSQNISKNINLMGLNKNAIKYPGYQNDHEQQFTNADQFSQIQEYQKSIRSNKPNRYMINNTLQMSAHQKKPYKKFSTQFPSLSEFQQPLMTLTNALRISANGLDKKERKVNKKIQMFKEREYSQMKSVSGNTNYMLDFMSVLQQESTNEKSAKNTDQNSNRGTRSPKTIKGHTNQQNPQKMFAIPQFSQKKGPVICSFTNFPSQNETQNFAHSYLTSPKIVSKQQNQKISSYEYRAAHKHQQSSKRRNIEQQETNNEAEIKIEEESMRRLSKSVLQKKQTKFQLKLRKNKSEIK